MNLRVSFRWLSLCVPTLGLLVLLGLSALAPSIASATFSIAAVDTDTGEVGSAGASCISGSIILSDVHPGVGIVHTQSYWNSQNQQYARLLMDQGYAPAAIIDSLVANDAQNNPGIRQYGIVDLVDGGRSASFTGSNCIDWKGQINGVTYAIQGNILLGSEIIEDMEIAFVSTGGSLAERLMAALQAAKVPGADTRCLSNGKSAISAFIRVAQPNDDNDYFLDLNVNNTSSSTDPIDVLQGLFDSWLTSSGIEDGGVVPAHSMLLSASPVPCFDSTTISFRLPESGHVRMRVLDPSGRLVSTLLNEPREPGIHSAEWRVPKRLGSGVYFYILEALGIRETGRVVVAR